MAARSDEMKGISVTCLQVGDILFLARNRVIPFKTGKHVQFMGDIDVL